MLLYTAGPYSGEVKDNIASARKISIELWEAGHYVVCPHLNTAHFEKDCKVQYEVYIAGDLDIVSRVDGLVMLPGWEHSAGARIEFDYAKSLGIPIWIYPDIPDKHYTEVSCPEQAKAFKETVMKMYRVHLNKNSDYSPSNILGTGEIGLYTRIWDKISRLMNLIGFDIKIESSEFKHRRSPKHESIDDTLMDNAVYSVIGLLLRQGKWGK